MDEIQGTCELTKITRDASCVCAFVSGGGIHHCCEQKQGM